MTNHATASELLAAAQAVIFDMDGVLVDSEKVVKLPWIEMAQNICTDFDPQLYPLVIGLSRASAYQVLQQHCQVTASYEEYVALRRQISLRVYGHLCATMPGVRELMASLHEQGKKMAIGSSAVRSSIDLVVQRFELSPYISAIASGQDLPPQRGKPHPDIFLLAASRCQVQPSDCVVIEDSAHGVAAAKAAGMTCLGLRNGFNDEQDLTAADVILPDGFAHWAASS